MNNARQVEDDGGEIPPLDRRIRGCLLVSAIVAVLLLVMPFAAFFLYKWNATRSAEASALKMAETFAEKVVDGWSRDQTSVRLADDAMAEVSVFSSRQVSDTLVVSVAASSNLESLFGVSPFVRCYTVSFESIDSAHPRPSVEPLRDCRYEIN